MPDYDQKFNVDDYENLKYAIGLMSLLLISIYFTAYTETRSERMVVLMFSVSMIGGALAWYVAKETITPKFLTQNSQLPIAPVL